MLEKLLSRMKAVQEVVAAEGTKVRISQVSAFAIIGEYKQRIFSDGLNSSRGSIGAYSTNAFYVNPLKLTGVPTSGIVPEGKTGKKVFANSGKPHKTKYLKAGYKELRELVGRQSDKVDLNFSGSLERSIQVVQEGNVSYVRYTSEKEAQKMEGNEERFSTKISELTKEEVELGQESARLELQEIFDQIDADSV
jgi:hypothetical protein